MKVDVRMEARAGARRIIIELSGEPDPILEAAARAQYNALQYGPPVKAPKIRKRRNVTQGRGFMMMRDHFGGHFIEAIREYRAIHGCGLRKGIAGAIRRARWLKKVGVK